MFDPRVQRGADSIVFRYSRAVSWLVWPIVPITLATLVASVVLGGWDGIMGVAVSGYALLAEVASLRTKAWIDRDGAHTRLFRTRTVSTSDIEQLYIRHVLNRGQHVESLAAATRDGSRLFLEASSTKCDADGSRRLEDYLREAQQLLGLPSTLIRRQGTLSVLNAIVFRQARQ